MSYDQKSYDLAMYFLADMEMDEALRKKHADTMAKDIQIAVENYIADEIGNGDGTGT